MKKLITNVALAVGVAGVVGLAGTAVYAATTATSELSQTINTDVLSTLRFLQQLNHAQKIIHH